MTYNHEGRQGVKTELCEEEGAGATTGHNTVNYLWCSKYISQGLKLHMQLLVPSHTHTYILGPQII